MAHPSSSPHTDLERELRVLSRRAQSSASTTARRVHPDLDASAFPLLAHIDGHPGVRGSDLATHFGVGRATVSRQLSRLEKLGLVQRETDPEDSRGQLLSLTADGEARFEAALTKRITSLEQALSSWAPADVAHLAELLGRYSSDVVLWLSTRQD